MSLDILCPVHLKKVKETGTIGVIDVADFKKSQHHYVDPSFWGMIDTTNYHALTSGGSGLKDRSGVFIGDSYYGFGGNTPDDTTYGELVKYTVTNPNTGAGSWSYLASGYPQKEVCLRTDGINLWAYGGYSSLTGGPSNVLQRYTVSSNTWSLLCYGGGTQPYYQTKHDTCIYDGYLYTYGGNNGEPITWMTDQFWRFDLSKSNSSGWEHLPSGPYPRYGHIVGAWNNKIYVFGGSDSLSPVWARNNKSILIYDITAGTWTVGSYCPFALGESEGFVYQDKMYIHSLDYVNGTLYNTIYVYDFINDFWTKRFSGGRWHSECSMACHYGTGNMYIYGGPPSWNTLDMWSHHDMALVIRKV